MRKPVQRGVKVRDICEICAGRKNLISYGREQGGFVHVICKACLKELSKFEPVTVRNDYSRID